MQKVTYYLHRIFSKRTKTVNDELITWISDGNAGWLHPGNIYCFDYVLKNIPSDDPIIEIGTFCGLSTNILASLLKKNNRKNRIITVDKWVFAGSEDKFIGDTDITFSEYLGFVKESFKKSVIFFNKTTVPYSIEAFSDDFFSLWKKESEVIDVLGRTIKLGGNISFAYIDGNHSYEFTERDFINADKFLVNGGFILFDDTHFNSPFGCAKFMKEMKNNHSYELVMKNPNYLFRKK